LWIKSVNERKTADKAARRDFRIRRERMKTSVIGFPRVGTLRELKFASEKYFRKETGAEKHADCEKHTGRYKKRQELITFHVMTFRFMIQCWIQPFC
jgi:hypothetical protein